MPSAKVYVGNLPDNLSREELEKEFGRYGNLKEIWIARNPCGFAFIEYVNHLDAEDSVKGLDGQIMWGGKHLKVAISHPKTPADAGSGFGKRDRSPVERGRRGNREPDTARPRDDHHRRGDDRGAPAYGAAGGAAYESRPRQRFNDHRQRSPEVGGYDRRGGSPPPQYGGGYQQRGRGGGRGGNHGGGRTQFQDHRRGYSPESAQYGAHNAAPAASDSTYKEALTAFSNAARLDPAAAYRAAAAAMAVLAPAAAASYAPDTAVAMMNQQQSQLMDGAYDAPYQQQHHGGGYGQSRPYDAMDNSDRRRDGMERRDDRGGRFEDHRSAKRERSPRERGNGVAGRGGGDVGRGGGRYGRDSAPSTSQRGKPARRPGSAGDSLPPAPRRGHDSRLPRARKTYV